MTEKNCPVCGNAIPQDAPESLCPRCLLKGIGQLETPVQRGLPPLEKVAEAFPKLEIIGLLGRGGMGAVYEARQLGLDRTVALKILAPHLVDDPEFKERFLREAQTLARLSHPGIVGIYDYGEAGGFYFLLMEFVDGVNLRQAMRDGGFTPEQALALVPEICLALQGAHEQGILHRDIKPENILLDTKGRVKIADFGIALLIGDPDKDFALTATGAQIGSGPYMAPEQYEHPESVDQRADIYSLGVVFYEMLTGELPIGRFSLPSEKIGSDLGLDDVVLKALEKERERRYQSADEVRTGVETFVPGKKVSPDRPLRSAVREFFGDAIDHVSKLVIWAIGFGLGGIIGGLLGREIGIGGAATFLISLGAVSYVVGFIAGWRALWLMRKSQISPAGRGWLAALFVLPLALAWLWLSGSMFVWTFSTKIYFLLDRWDWSGMILALWLVIVSCYAGAWAFFTFADLKRKSGKFWGNRRTVIVGLGLIVIGVGICKYFEGDLPISGGKYRAEIDFGSRVSQVHREEANEEFRSLLGRYTDRVEVDERGIGFTSRSFPQAKSHGEVMWLRFVSLKLPEERFRNGYKFEKHSFTAPADRYSLVVFIAVACAGGALLLAVGMRSVSLKSIGAVGIVFIVLSLTSRVPQGGTAKLLHGPPLPQLEPVTHPLDFSSPVSAARSLHAAAVLGNHTAVEQGLSGDVIGKIADEKRRRFFLEALKHNVLSVEAQTTAKAQGVAKVRVHFASFTAEWQKGELGFVEEDGMWKLADLGIYSDL